MTQKSLREVSLQLVLPATNATLPETIRVEDFAAEGTAIEYGFVDTNRMSVKYGTQGTATGWKNPNTTKYIEFRVRPASDIDKKLNLFTLSESNTGMGILLKDRVMDVKIASEQGFFRVVNANVLGADPDYKTYRIELLQSIIGSL